MTPKAVLFDCDGVIVDSEPATFALLQQDLAAHGLAVSLASLEQDYIGGTMADVASRASQNGATLPADWVDRFYAKLYSHLATGTPLIAGILPLLDRLDAANIPYAIGSNGSAEKMQVTLGQHPALYRRLEGRMFSGQSLGKAKPAPDLYLHAAAALHTAARDCVVIEDSATGARAARAAGMRCFGYAPHGNPRLAAEGAILFSDMHALPALLNL